MKKPLEKLVVEFLGGVDDDIKLRDFQVGHLASLRRDIENGRIEKADAANKIVSQLASDGVRLDRDKASKLTSLINNNF